MRNNLVWDIQVNFVDRKGRFSSDCVSANLKVTVNVSDMTGVPSLLNNGVQVRPERREEAPLRGGRRNGYGVEPKPATKYFST